jgi:cytochrome c5
MTNVQVKAVFIAVVFVMATAALAQKTSIQLPADNPMAQLKSGAGEETVRKDCGFCHSTDYIVIQPHLTAKQWDGEVQKMTAVYGAPIGPADAKMISHYLAASYSSEAAPSNKNDSK